MSIAPSNHTTTPDPDGHYKPKNPLGEHTENVDIRIVRYGKGKHWATTITIHAVIDHKTEGAPYEETGRELLFVTTRSVEGDWSADHWQSWFDIQSNGWSDKDDVLHHQSPAFQQLVKALAEAGLAIVRSVQP